MEAALHFSMLDIGTAAGFAKMYILEGIGMFLAVSPVIAVVYRLKKEYWLALVFAEIYSMLGLFAGMNNVIRSLCPITAAFSISGYYEATPGQFITSVLSLLACGALSLLILFRLDSNE